MDEYAKDLTRCFVHNDFHLQEVANAARRAVREFEEQKVAHRRSIESAKQLLVEAEAWQAKRKAVLTEWNPEAAAKLFPAEQAVGDKRKEEKADDAAPAAKRQKTDEEGHYCWTILGTSHDEEARMIVFPKSLFPEADVQELRTWLNMDPTEITDAMEAKCSAMMDQMPHELTHQEHSKRIGNWEVEVHAPQEM
jgi:hypothetical protein